MSEAAEASGKPQKQDKDLASEPGGFACIVEQSDLLEYFKTFDSLVQEMRLQVTQEGFYAAAVDPANVAMVEDTLSTDAFEHYSSTGGTLGLNLNRVIDVLSLGSTGDLVNLELDLETRKLEIEIEGMSYTLALIDPESVRQEPDIPDLGLPADITLTSEQFERGLTAADMVSDHVRLRVSGDTFIIEAEGDTDDVDLKLPEEDLVSLEGDDANSLFSLDYLKDMKKAFPKGGEVAIELGEEFPVKFHFDHVWDDEGEEAYAEATMMLAPRIVSD